MSLASWVQRSADSMLERSTWQTHSPTARWVSPAACWLLAVGACFVVMALVVDAPSAIGIAITLVIAAWFGVLLSAYVTNSKPLMRAAVWGVGVVGLAPLFLVVLNGS